VYDMAGVSVGMKWKLQWITHYCVMVLAAKTFECIDSIVLSVQDLRQFLILGLTKKV